MNLTQAAKEVGVGLPTLSYWLRIGLIKPPGYKRKRRIPVRIGPEELRELCIIKRLRAFISLQKLRGALAYLRSIGHNPLSSGDFLVIGERLIKVCGPDEVIELSRKYRGQLILVPWWNEDKES
jgi:hypothetical protein